MMHPLVNYFWQGRSVLKRGKGDYFDDIDKPKKACYIGAMYYGMEHKTAKNPANLIYQDWPQIRHWTDVPCGCDKEGGTIASILIHLNDEHSQWTDKKISDWLNDALDGKAYPSKEEYDKSHLP